LLGNEKKNRCAARRPAQEFSETGERTSGKFATVQLKLKMTNMTNMPVVSSILLYSVLN